MRPALFLTLALVTGMPGLSAQKELPPAPPPPMAQAAQASLYQGQSVEIPLRGVGRIPGQLRFLIRTKPSSGSLGKIRLTSRSTAVVVYTHDGKSGPGVDGFTYAVQNSDSPVSAPGKVQLLISEKPPRLEAAESLDFGAVLLGETHTDELVLSNSGGGYIVGTLSVPGGWRLDGPPDYQIAAGKSVSFPLAFHPTEERKYSGRIRFSHDPLLGVSVRGEGISPFGFSPAGILELGQDPARTGSLEIENRTEQERVLQINTSSDLVAPESARVPGGGRVTAKVSVRAGFLGVIEGTIDFAGDGFLHRVEVRATAAPPALSADAGEGFHFGEIPTGEGRTAKWTVQNTGGLDARLRADFPRDVLVVPDPNTVVLAPGQSRTFEITVEPSRTGPFSATLEIGAPGANSLSAALSAEVAAPKIARRPFSLEIPIQIQPETAPPSAALPAPPPPGLPTITEIEPLPAPLGTALIGWKPPSDKAASYLIEERRLTVKGSGQPPLTEWLNWPDWKIQEDGGRMTARIDHLPRGRIWFLRIVALDPTGQRSASSPVFRVATPPPRPSPLPWIFGFLLLAAGASWYWRRRRRKAQIVSREEAARMAQLEPPR